MRLFVACLAAALLTSSSALSDNKPTSDWSTYGAPITLKKTSKLDQVMSKQVGKEVLIQGTIADVCQNKGCWMTVRDKKQEVRVEFKDYGFFVPWSTGGKSIRMQGVLTEKVMSPEDQKHIVSESKQGGGVRAPAETPKKLFVFVASGVAIQGGGELSAEQKSKVGGKSEAHDHDHSAPGHKH